MNTDHDPLCLTVTHPMGAYTLCDCGTIRMARADERERMRAEVAATAKWCREDERETIAAAIEAEAAVQRDFDPIYTDGLQDAARIARDGGNG